MNKRLLLLFVLTFLLWTPGRSDIVYPARLEIVQTSDSTYEVFFVLPVIQGRILKAQPVLPSGAKVLADPTVAVNNFSKSIRWLISSPDLIGSQVGIDGLGGSQVDILLRIEWLNGRVIQTTLSPVRPFYIIPPSPSTFKLFSEGFAGSFKEGISHGYLTLFLILVSLSFTRKVYRNIAISVLLGSGLGIVLAANDLLIIPLQYIDSILLFVCAGIALSIFANVSWAIENHAAPIIFIVLAALGAAIITTETFQGFTITDKIIWSLGSIGGFLFAISILSSASYLISRARQIRRKEGKQVLKPFWIFLSVTLIAASIVEASLYYTPIPIYLTLAAFLIIAPFMSINMGLLCLALGTGGVLGFHYNISIAFLIVPAFTIFLWAAMSYQKTYIKGFTWLFLAAAAACAAIIASIAVDNESFPAAKLTGFFMLYILFILIVPSIEMNLKPVAGNRPLLAMIIIAAAVFFIIDMSSTFKLILAEANAIGRIPIPVLSLLLIIAVIWIWPRQKKIHAEMNVKKASKLPAICLAGLALFVIPLWTIDVTIPGASQSKISDTQARAILERTLSDTYTAFNLRDDDALYNQLSGAVDESLIDQVYLDSRRRLNAGVREGAEVSVKDVQLLTIKAETNSNNEQVFEATWVVVARVKHLQHVHHRKNKYEGDIALRQGDSAWKIARINLSSEDRTIVPAGSL